MWVLVQYEYEKFFKRRWMASTMCIVWKSQGINISQKKWDERLVFYKNVYGTVIKSILTDIDENEKKLSMVMDLLTAFFHSQNGCCFMTPTKWLCSYSVVISLKICFNLRKCLVSFPFCKIFLVCVKVLYEL